VSNCPHPSHSHLGHIGALLKRRCGVKSQRTRVRVTCWKEKRKERGEPHTKIAICGMITKGDCEGAKETNSKKRPYSRRVGMSGKANKKLKRLRGRKTTRNGLIIFPPRAKPHVITERSQADHKRKKKR